MSRREIITDTEEMRQHQRPTPKVGDPEKVRLALQDWFAERLGDVGAVRIPELNIPEASGMSNITLIFDVLWRDGSGDQSKGYAARLQPNAGKLVFPEYDLGLQYHCMDKLKDLVPVPAMLGLELDPAVIGQPFFIMEKLDGVVPPDMPPMHLAGWVAEQTTLAQREQLWWSGLEAMAKVHAADWRSLGFEFMHHPERGGEHATAQLLHYWQEYLRWAPEGIPHPEYERCMQWFIDNRPEDELTGLCWGDARLGNTMYTPDYKSVLALLDWEMAVLGNPVKDLAWWLFLDEAVSKHLGIGQLEGFPTEEESVAYWRRATGLDASAYQYYKLHAAYAFGLILTRTAICSGADDPAGNNFITPVMSRMLDELGG